MYVVKPPSKETETAGAVAETIVYTHLLNRKMFGYQLFFKKKNYLFFTKEE